MPGFALQNGPRGACHSNLGYDTPIPLSSDLSPANTTETVRRHRYLFETLEPLDKENLLLFAHSCTRPSVEIDQITVHNGQDEIYRPGKSRWIPIELTLYERIFGEIDAYAITGGGYNQAAEVLYEWWAKTMINVTNSLHSAPSNYRKPAQISMLDGLGTPIWGYFLANCWPMKISPCDISYSDTEIADITVTLSYDKAIERRMK